MTADWASAYAGAASAVATLLAVIVALYVSGADARRRAKDDERRQAEQITGWMEFLPEDKTVVNEKMWVKLILQNASNQLAYNLIASVVNANTEEHVGDNYCFRNYLGRLPLGKTEYTIEHPGHGMHKRFSIELAFDDAGGRTWVRRGKGGLLRVKKDPLAFYDITPPVSWLMP
jgi:hypothetical protein